MSKPPSPPSVAIGSLVSPAAMGGIVGGKGFDFQTRYTVCHLPLWLQDGAFHQIFSEGTGDIDIRYLENGKSTRKHIQTKDHEVITQRIQGGNRSLPWQLMPACRACTSVHARMSIPLCSAKAGRNGFGQVTWR